MKKVIVHENQKALLLKNGRFVKLLSAGKYHFFGDSQIELLPLDQALASEFCPLETLLADPDIAAQTVSVAVADDQLALHMVDGRFAGVLRAGRHAFWNTLQTHSFRLIDTQTPELPDDLSPELVAALPDDLLIRVDVSEYQKGLLYQDRRFQRILEPGTYAFWHNGTPISVRLADTRLTQMNITGQEILTQDKVSLRISYVCNYRITDFERAFSEIDDYAEQLHVAAQLAMRDYIGSQRLDDLLAAKDQLSAYVLQRLREKAAACFVEIEDGGVKDIILPGEIRDIMNTVLMAEKQAQANVIARREEVASTRSLLNTAKLMDENQTLYRLKELETMERICANVGSINLSGCGDILAQLEKLLHGRKD